MANRDKKNVAKFIKDRHSFDDGTNFHSSLKKRNKKRKPKNRDNDK